MELIAQLNLTFYLAALFFGLVVGSFLNVVAWRWPREESIVYPGSHCPRCGKPIAWYDNIPVVSWLLLRGRCRSCREKISIRYPLIELASGSLSVLCFFCFGLSKAYFIYFAFASSLLAASIIDLEHRLIPDEISIGGAVVGLGLAFLPGARVEPSAALLGACAGFLLLFAVAQGYYLLTKREGMGLGDAKLLAMIGAFLGWRSLPLAIFAGSVLGSLVGLLLILASRDRFYKIPFGPFLSLGALLWLVLWAKNYQLNLGPFARFLGIGK
jgi:leader peptidase (prepilin peptidase)/N-methyltransferase